MSTATTTRDCRTCWECMEWWTDEETGLKMVLCGTRINGVIFDQIAENGCDGYSRETKD